MALTRCEVVTFDIRGMNLLAAKNLCDDFRCANDNAPTYFDNPPLLTTFVNLGITHSEARTRRECVRGRPGPRLTGGGSGVLSWAMRASTEAGSLSEVNQGGRPSVLAFNVAKTAIASFSRR